MKSRDFKRQAKASLKGNWGAAVFATFIYVIIILVLSSAPGVAFGFNSSWLDTSNPAMAFTPEMLRWFFGLTSTSMLLTIFLLYPIELGATNSFNKLHVTGDSQIAENIFRIGFKNYSHNVLGMLHMMIMISLWSLLLIIPGIIKAFSYAMTPYILADRPELSTRQAIHESRRMMKGRKWKLFCLSLSFIGWFFLIVFTLGIALLWVYPYAATSQAAFYQNILEEEKAEMAASFSTAAPKPETVKVKDFEPSNHADYAPKEDSES